MTRQTMEPLRHFGLSAGNREARGVAQMASEYGWLDINPPYQRGSVWSADQQIALVRSWMMGIPVPAVIVNDRSNSAWVAANGDPGERYLACVDGKQRIETSVAWFTGSLAVPASWLDAEDITDGATLGTEDGPYVTYEGFTLAGQRRMARRAFLPVIEAKVASIAEEADLYLLVNGGGTPQTEADLDNAARHGSAM